MYSHRSKNGTNTCTTPGIEDKTVLMEVGEWKLVRSICPQFTGVDSYPVHMCGPNGIERMVSRPLVGGAWCSVCKEKMPPEILGLWVLHNWEVATQ
jgi:hypothetical protein